MSDRRTTHRIELAQLLSEHLCEIAEWRAPDRRSAELSHRTDETGSTVSSDLRWSSSLDAACREVAVYWTLTAGGLTSCVLVIRVRVPFSPRGNGTANESICHPRNLRVRSPAISRRQRSGHQCGDRMLTEDAGSLTRSRNGEASPRLDLGRNGQQEVRPTPRGSRRHVCKWQDGYRGPGLGDFPNSPVQLLRLRLDGEKIQRLRS